MIWLFIFIVVLHVLTDSETRNISLTKQKNAIMSECTTMKLHEPNDYFYVPDIPGYDLGISTRLVIEDLVCEGEEIGVNE